MDRKPERAHFRRIGLVALAACTLAVGAASAPVGAESPRAAAQNPVRMTLITKDPSNHFWVAMMNGAKSAGAEVGADITLASGRDQTDADSQIQAIENAVSRGDSAILIANNGPAVNDAITAARKAGLLVIALDTPTTPTNLVDATFASDNLEAGKLIGQWAASSLKGEPATIAMLDLFADKIVGIDIQRDHGFLTGMGIDPGDPTKNGAEAKTGSYSGGTYEIVCHGATNGAEDGGRSVMENCLSVNPNINVVFTANETSGVGAVQALKAAGNHAAVVSIDGSCRGVSEVQNGDFGAVSQQYPYQMGYLGVKAVVDWVNTQQLPTPPEGTDFVNTGIKLITDSPVPSIDSLNTVDGTKVCW